MQALRRSLPFLVGLSLPIAAGLFCFRPRDYGISPEAPLGRLPPFARTLAEVGLVEEAGSGETVYADPDPHPLGLPGGGTVELTCADDGRIVQIRGAFPSPPESGPSKGKEPLPRAAFLFLDLWGILSGEPPRFVRRDVRGLPREEASFREEMLRGRWSRSSARDGEWFDNEVLIDWTLDPE